MTANDHTATDSGGKSDGMQAEPRSPHSIRFSDTEWRRIEQEARKREMSAAELVRHAAVSFATDRLSASSPALPPEIVAQIERIYRGVYLLATLKRDEMFRDERRDELERIMKDARTSQSAIVENPSGMTM